MLGTDSMSRQRLMPYTAYYRTSTTVKLHFRLQFYFNFRSFKVIYCRAINATVRQLIPVIYDFITTDKLS